MIKTLIPFCNNHPWFAEAINMEATGMKEGALDLLFDELDNWLLNENFEKCSIFLKAMPVDTLTNAMLLTILTITLPARLELSERKSFFNRVQAELQIRDKKSATRLLFGLAGEDGD